MVASILFAALWGAFFGASAEVAPDFVTLGSVRIGGAVVPMRVPSGRDEHGAPGRYVVWHEGARPRFDAEGNLANGWRYLLYSDYLAQDRVLETGGWRDVVTLYNRARPNLPNAVVWRVKVLVLAATLAVNTDQEGVCVRRRGRLGEREIGAIKDALAQTKAMVEAYEDGRIRLEFDFAVDRETWWESDSESGEEDLPDETRTDRFPGGPLDSGSVQDSWVIHPPTVGLSFMGFQPEGVPAAFRAVLRYRGATMPDGSSSMVPAMVSAFATGAGRLAAERIGRNPVDGRSNTAVLGALREALTSEDWREMVGPFRPAVRRAALARALRAQPRPWSDVTRPMLEVPLETPRLRWLFMPLEYGRPPKADARLVGGPDPTPFPTIAQRLGTVVAGSEAPPQGLYPEGGADVQYVNDPERGRVLQLTRRERERIVTDLGATGKAGLEFWVRWEGNEPFGIEFHAIIERGGMTVSYYAIANRFVTPSAQPIFGRSHLSGRLAPPGDGRRWTRVLILTQRRSPMNAVLVTPRFEGMFEAPPRPLRIWIAGVRQLDEIEPGTAAEDAGADGPNPESDDWYERAWAAALIARTSHGSDASATEADLRLLTSLLGDRDERVVLTAVRRLTHFVYPPAEKRLASLAGHPDTVTAEAALRALAKIGSATAWRTIREALRTSEDGVARRTAARLVGSCRRPEDAAEIGRLRTGGWRDRRAVVEVLAEIGPTTEDRRLSFADDPHPSVRAAVADHADLKAGRSLRAVLVMALRDGSAWVRGRARRALLLSGDDFLVRQGFAGLFDANPLVRYRTVGEGGGLPDRMRWAAARVLLRDPHPDLVALGARLASGTKLDWSEVRSLAESGDPGCERALVRLIAAQCLPRDEARLTALGASRWPEVREAIGALRRDLVADRQAPAPTE